MWVSRSQVYTAGKPIKNVQSKCTITVWEHRSECACNALKTVSWLENRWENVFPVHIQQPMAQIRGKKRSLCFQITAEAPPAASFQPPPRFGSKRARGAQDWPDKRVWMWIWIPLKMWRASTCFTFLHKKSFFCPRFLPVFLLSPQPISFHQLP